LDGGGESSGSEWKKKGWNQSRKNALITTRNDYLDDPECSHNHNNNARIKMNQVPAAPNKKKGKKRKEEAQMLLKICICVVVSSSFTSTIYL
jgi:hypothetical protein